jgi:hypothetical protein
MLQAVAQLARTVERELMLFCCALRSDSDARVLILQALVNFAGIPTSVAFFRRFQVFSLSNREGTLLAASNEKAGISGEED